MNNSATKFKIYSMEIQDFNQKGESYNDPTHLRTRN